MTTVTTKLEIRNWDEQPYRELPDGGKLTRAVVDLAGAEDELQVEGVWQALMYYRPDGTSTYVGQMYLTGTLEGRTGSFLLEGTGSFDGTAARNTAAVVTGSGTDALAGLSGTALSVSTHQDYPHWPMTFTYELG